MAAVGNHAAELLGGEHGGGIVDRVVEPIARLLALGVLREGFFEKVRADVAAPERIRVRPVSGKEAFGVRLDGAGNLLLHAHPVGLGVGVAADFLGHRIQAAAAAVACLRCR